MRGRSAFQVVEGRYAVVNDVHRQSGLRGVEALEQEIDVLVGRLRRKIEEDPKRPQLILTVRGEGYRFTPRVTWSASPD